MDPARMQHPRLGGLGRVRGTRQRHQVMRLDAEQPAVQQFADPFVLQQMDAVNVRGQGLKDAIRPSLPVGTGTRGVGRDRGV